MEPKSASCMTSEELRQWKLERFGLRDDYDLMAWDALGFALHRQWLYLSNALGYGDRVMAARHFGDVIRNAATEAAGKATQQ